jgi:hypothetical protein
MDFDATSVSIVPKCGFHNVDLICGDDYRPFLFPEKETVDAEVTEWFVDLSEFSCPVTSKALSDTSSLTDDELDTLFTADQGSWYMSVAIDVRPEV